MSIDRLKSLQHENDTVGAEMLIKSERFAALASRHENGTAPRAVSAFNLFQTPVEIAEKMAALIPAGSKTILEPSAGLGRLYRAARKRLPGSSYTIIENAGPCLKELYQLIEGHNTVLKGIDFLEYNPQSLFDTIIMNPPFKMGTDIKHILHARKMLATGGILISLCYNGVKQNRDLKPICSSWVVLPDGSFKKEGTQASISLLTIKN